MTDLHHQFSKEHFDTTITRKFITQELCFLIFLQVIFLLLSYTFVMTQKKKKVQ
jgi:hypothetical protein